MPRKRHLDPSQVATARAMYEIENLSLDKIGKKFGCSAITVGKELKELGVTMKGPGRRPKQVVPALSAPEITRSW